MIGREIDRFVQENASVCKECCKYSVQIGRKFSDLNHALRAANRNPSPKNIATVKTRKASLVDQRLRAKEHADTDHG